jgi:hypothetical protein
MPARPLHIAVFVLLLLAGSGALRSAHVHVAHRAAPCGSGAGCAAETGESGRMPAPATPVSGRDDCATCVLLSITAAPPLPAPAIDLPRVAGFARPDLRSIAAARPVAPTRSRAPPFTA